MNIVDLYRNSKITAVIRANDKNFTLEVADALIKGGIKIIEITVGSPEMYEVIDVLSKNTDVKIVAGGVITSRQAQEAMKYDIKAIVSPIFQPGLIKLCQAKDIPVITTATTANEAYQAWKAGVKLIKIFPTEQMGGAAYVQDLLRPMPFLNVVATGSIKCAYFIDYLNAGACAVTIGRDFWLNASKSEIIERAKDAVQKANNIC